MNDSAKYWLLLVLAGLFGHAHAATRYVGNCGSPTSTTIAAAIAAASAGDSILVCPGTYAESLSIAKSITVRGSTGNAADVTITSSGMAIQATAGTLTLKDMTVTSTGATAVY